MTRRVSFGDLAAALLTAALLLALLPQQATAQLGSSSPPMQVDLVDINGVLADDDDDFALTLDLASGRVDRLDVRITATIFGRVSSGPQLSAALSGSPRNPFSTIDVEIGELDRGLTRRIALQATREELDLDGDNIEGVYPLEVQVFEGADPVGELHTALVVDPSARRQPMPSSLVLDIAGSNVPLDGVQVDDALVADLVADGPLIRTTRALEQITAGGSAAGLVLAVDGRLISDLDIVATGAVGAERFAARAARVRGTLTAAARRADVQVLAMPYARADLTALSNGGLGDEAIHLVERGRDAVADLLGVEPAPSLLATPIAIDTATIAVLSPLLTELYLPPVETIVVPAVNAQMQPLRRIQTADGGELRVLRADSSLTALLEDPGSRGTPAVVQDLLAHTALRWIRGSRVTGTPSTRGDDTAGVLLHLPDPEVVAEDVLPAVIDALSSAPWLRPVNATRLADLVAPSRQAASLAYESRRVTDELDSRYVQQLAEAHGSLRPLNAMLPADSATTERLHRSLDLAASAAHRTPAGEPAGLARIQEVLSRTQQIALDIDVYEGPPLTLTSTTGEVPVLLRSKMDVPVLVRVRATSTRFTITEPVLDVELQPDAAQTITFDVQALNPGALAGVNIVVEDPTGTIVLEQTRIAVRSTAFPVVALVATVGGALLLLWWGLRQGRRRRTGEPGERPGRATADETDEAVA